MLNASILPTPAGWQKKPLVDLVDFLDSRRIPIKEQDRAKMAGDIPYYGASGIIDYVNQYIFDEDIILLAEDGANILNRSTPIAFRVSGKCWVNNHAHVFAAKSNADPEYIVQFLEAIRYDAFNSGSAQPKLNREICEQIPVLTPSLPEQRKIAAILRTWDLGLEKLSALRKAKELRFKGLSQRLLAPARAIGRGIPRSNWTLSSFGEVFSERRDANRSLGPDDVVTVGKYAIRKQSEHFTRSVASQDLGKYWIISPGDFVYDPMSAYYGAIGRYGSSGDGLVSPAYRVIRLDTSVDAEFMTHLLRSQPIRFLLEARSSQGNKEGKRRLLQRDEFAGIEFNLPPIEVQREIASRLALAQRDLELTDREIAALTRQKRGLMQKLLTGEWEVSP